MTAELPFTDAEIERAAEAAYAVEHQRMGAPTDSMDAVWRDVLPDSSRGFYRDIARAVAAVLIPDGCVVIETARLWNMIDRIEGLDGECVTEEEAAAIQQKYADELGIPAPLLPSEPTP